LGGKKEFLRGRKGVSIKPGRDLLKPEMGGQSLGRRGRGKNRKNKKKKASANAVIRTALKIHQGKKRGEKKKNARVADQEKEAQKQNCLGPNDIRGGGESNKPPGGVTPNQSNVFQKKRPKSLIENGGPTVKWKKKKRKYLDGKKRGGSSGLKTNTYEKNRSKKQRSQTPHPQTPSEHRISNRKGQLSETWQGKNSHPDKMFAKK